MKEPVGMPPKELSPAPSTTSGHPPCVIFHGTVDDTTTFATAEKFTELMKRAGNDCPFHPFEGKGHVFLSRSRVKWRLRLSPSTGFSR